RAHPAVPSVAPLERRRRAHADRTRVRYRGARTDDGADRRRDGGADSGRRRCPDDLRHGEGRRSGDDDRRHPSGVQERRPERHVSETLNTCNPEIAQSLDAMNVLIGVVSYASAWVMPRAFVDQLRRDFPHHAFLEAWDFDAIRRLIPEADVAFV